MDDLDGISVEQLRSLARNNRSNRDLVRKVVYHSNLVPVPTTVPGEGDQQEEQVDDGIDHEDDEINVEDLMDPKDRILVDRHDRIIITPHGTDFQPQKATSAAISFILQGNYQEPWLTWGEIKKAKIGQEQVWDRFWKAFKMKCTWFRDINEKTMITIFDHKCSKRLSTLLGDARTLFYENKEPPAWIGPGDVWTELKRRWSTPAYMAKCNRNKQNRVGSNLSVHTGGSTSASTLRIRFTRQFGRPPTLCQMNVMLHMKPDGTWDTVKAQRANDMIKVYIEELKATEAALPLALRKTDVELQNMILDKFVEFSGGKYKGRIVGQGSTSSLVQRTTRGYMMDNMSDSYDSTATMPTGRSQRVESIEELEQRLRAEQQQSIASMREEMMTQLRAELSSGIPGQSNQQQFQQQPFQQQPFQQQQFQQQPFQQQQFQQQLQQQQRPNQSQRQQNSNNFNYMTGVNYAVQQIQNVGRNSQSSYQSGSLHEDPAEEEGYRPGEVDLNVSSDPDENFFTGLQNNPLLQGMLGQQGQAMLGDLEIPGFTVHDSTSMNQGGIISPLVHSGGNSQGRGVGSSSEMSMGGGRASAGMPSVGRTSAGRAIVGRGSGGRTSAGRRGRGNSQNA
ncbi:uncharacterized protein LOC123898230 [Trifolium pratense]|uniref:uncharacterized protein LOC123898230 n=1 Tax=Trifolium pratense TaxID=57577 RepID=UPI001E6930C3|nr:uncharacterized protein LOC123898230 [Trifolium pratense]